MQEATENAIPDRVFWADIVQDKIVKQCLSNGSFPEVPAMVQLSSVEWMAFDHISKIFCFVDGTRKSIELVRVDAHKESHMRKIILSSAVLGDKSNSGVSLYTLSKVTCFLVIGQMKLPAWAGPGWTGHIILSSLTPTTKGRSRLGWPNGLTIDFSTEGVYLWMPRRIL